MQPWPVHGQIIKHNKYLIYELLSTITRILKLLIDPINILGTNKTYQPFIHGLINLSQTSLDLPWTNNSFVDQSSLHGPIIPSWTNHPFMDQLSFHGPIILSWTIIPFILLLTNHPFTDQSSFHGPIILSYTNQS